MSPLDEDHAIARALAILDSRLRSEPAFSSPRAVQDFLRLKSQGLEHEVFAVMYLDAQHRMIDYERLFRGTLTHAPIFPREVVKQALAKNAASVVLHHNHPAGTCTPSLNDQELTRRLADALGLVDIRVLDHVISSDTDCFSMAESAMLY